MEWEWYGMARLLACLRYDQLQISCVYIHVCIYIYTYIHPADESHVDTRLLLIGPSSSLSSKSKNSVFGCLAR